MNMDLTKNKSFPTYDMEQLIEQLPNGDAKTALLEVINLQTTKPLEETSDGYCCPNCGNLIFAANKPKPESWSAHCDWCGQKYSYYPHKYFLKV